MPWRLILFILIFGILLTFIMLNIGEYNRCDISFGFKTIPQVPVFLTIFISFFLGLLCALPLSLVKRKQKEKPLNANKNEKVKTEKDSYEPLHVEPDEKIKQEAADAKKRFFARRKGK